MFGHDEREDRAQNGRIIKKCVCGLYQMMGFAVRRIHTVGPSGSGVVIRCVRKVAVHLQKVLKVMSTSVYTGINKSTYRSLSVQRLSERTECIYISMD
jgi:hypothetical protein